MWGYPRDGAEFQTARNPKRREVPNSGAAGRKNDTEISGREKDANP
jgi:hypothetical protein